MAITLKAARVNAGFNQKEAAIMLKISEYTLSNYERGISYPDVPVLKKIEEVYGIKYSDIIFLPKDYGLTE